MTSHDGPHLDNADPHTATVHLTRYQAGWSYDVDVNHPDTCTSEPADCAAASYIEAVGIDPTFTEPFPDPSDLTDAEQEAVDGTSAHFVATRSFEAWDNHNNPDDPDHDIDYSEDYTFTWVDQPPKEA